MKQLKEMFPHISTLRIKEVLKKCSVIEAIDVLVGTTLSSDEELPVIDLTVKLKK